MMKLILAGGALASSALSTPVNAQAMGAMAMPGMTTPMPESSTMTMKAALGGYPETRESSGTAWQPDASRHVGLMTMAGGWSLMAHARLMIVADTQSGPRGASRLFPAGMVMGMAQHALGQGTVQFKAMVSPDPLMGKRGYPLLLASGETADGVTRLVDRQHPHDLFMELSASVSQPIGHVVSAFVYAALPGEPAFGPPAFMHREAILDSPEAPISHHWLDSTHISFGVLTAGVVVGRAKLEASRFNGREPDQRRANIETGPLDSTAIRASWNPTARLALQASWGRFTSPEQLEPGVDQTRWSASALYARDIGSGHLAATLAWGRKQLHGEKLDAFAAETSYAWGDWTVFARAERTTNDELVDGITATVGKVSAGAIRDFAIAPHVKLGIGALAARNFVPTSLDPTYGGDRSGAMGFIRLKLD